MPASETIRDLSFGDAEAVLERAQRLLNEGDLSGTMKTFAPDIVVRFADFPETVGKPPLEKFLAASGRLRAVKRGPQIQAGGVGFPR